jgi:hypothetical protein
MPVVVVVVVAIVIMAMVMVAVAVMSRMVAAGRDGERRREQGCGEDERSGLACDFHALSPVIAR